MKRVAILQSNYIPWKGYFDLIASVDEFIIYDDMQYTRRDWRNRNIVKTPHGTRWLTVPVKTKGQFSQSIKDTLIDGEEWAETHWKSMYHSYHLAPYFQEVSAILEETYTKRQFATISELNSSLITTVCDYLQIGTTISRSWDYTLIEGKTERLVDLCRQASATEYISGPSAKNYIDDSCFQEAGIQLTWFDYGGYPEYPQLWGSFVHEVSILDLLFNCGPDAGRYMKYVGRP